MDNNVMTSKINEAIFSAISSVSQKREEYYKTNKVPTMKDAKDIISTYSNLNAGVSGIAGAIPGPIGMATVVPEMITVLNNQIKMIYDIGKAYNQEKVMTKELIIGIMVDSIGRGAGALLTVQAGKVMSKRVGARALQKIIAVLGLRVGQKVLSAMATRWIPIAGAIAMASWSKYSTHKIGEKAIEVFSKEIIIEDELIEQEIDLDIKEESPIISIEQNNNLIIARVELMINLMNIDSYKHQKEIEHIKEYINSLAVTSTVKSKLLMSLAKTEQINIDYTQFNNSQDEAINILSDLISLAKKDGQFHPKEEAYVQEVGIKLGFTAEEMSYLL